MKLALKEDLTIQRQTTMSHLKLTMLLQQTYLGDWYESVRQDENWMRFREKCDTQQFDVYVKWLNLQFSRYLYDKTGRTFEEAKHLYCWLRVTNLQDDLEDGLRFLYLVDILYNVTLSKEFGPKKIGCMKLHKIRNHDTCLQYLKSEANLRCVGINALDLANGNIKMLTGLLFLLMSDFESRVFKDSSFIQDSQLKLNVLRNSLAESDQREMCLLSKSHSHIFNNTEQNVRSYVKNTSVKYNQRIQRLSCDQMIFQQRKSGIKKTIPKIHRRRRSSTENEQASIKQQIAISSNKPSKSTLNSNLESFTFGEFYIPAVPLNQLEDVPSKLELHYPEHNILRGEVAKDIDSIQFNENDSELNYSELNEIKHEYTQEMNANEPTDNKKDSFGPQQADKGEVSSPFNHASLDINYDDLTKSTSELSTDSHELESVDNLDMLERNGSAIHLVNEIVSEALEILAKDENIVDIGESGKSSTTDSDLPQAELNHHIVEAVKELFPQTIQDNLTDQAELTGESDLSANSSVEQVEGFVDKTQSTPILHMETKSEQETDRCITNDELVENRIDEALIENENSSNEKEKEPESLKNDNQDEVTVEINKVEVTINVVEKTLVQSVEVIKQIINEILSNCADNMIEETDNSLEVTSTVQNNQLKVDEDVQVKDNVDIVGTNKMEIDNYNKSTESEAVIKDSDINEIHSSDNSFVEQIIDCESIQLEVIQVTENKEDNRIDTPIDITDNENYFIEKEIIKDSLVNDYNYIETASEIITNNNIVSCDESTVEPIADKSNINQEDNIKEEVKTNKSKKKKNKKKGKKVEVSSKESSVETIDKCLAEIVPKDNVIENSSKINDLLSKSNENESPGKTFDSNSDLLVEETICQYELEPLPEPSQIIKGELNQIEPAPEPFQINIEDIQNEVVDNENYFIEKEIINDSFVNDYDYLNTVNEVKTKEIANDKITDKGNNNNNQTVKPKEDVKSSKNQKKKNKKKSKASTVKKDSTNPEITSEKNTESAKTFSEETFLVEKSEPEIAKEGAVDDSIKPDEPSQESKDNELLNGMVNLDSNDNISVETTNQFNLEMTNVENESDANNTSNIQSNESETIDKSVLEITTKENIVQASNNVGIENIDKVVVADNSNCDKVEGNIELAVTDNQTNILTVKTNKNKKNKKKGKSSIDETASNEPFTDTTEVAAKENADHHGQDVVSNKSSEMLIGSEVEVILNVSAELVNVPLITVDQYDLVESKPVKHFTELMDNENYLVKNDAINDSLVNDYNFISNSKDEETFSWSSNDFLKTESKEGVKSDRSDSAHESLGKKSTSTDGILYSNSGKTEKSESNSSDIDEIKNGLYGMEDNTEALLDNSIDSDYDSSMIRTENDFHENLMQKSVDCIDESFEDEVNAATEVEYGALDNAKAEIPTDLKSESSIIEEAVNQEPLIEETIIHVEPEASSVKLELEASEPSQINIGDIQNEVVDNENYFIEKEIINDSFVNDYDYLNTVNEVKTKEITDKVINNEIQTSNQELNSEDNHKEILKEQVKTNKNRKKRNKKKGKSLFETSESLSKPDELPMESNENELPKERLIKEARETLGSTEIETVKYALPESDNPLDAKSEAIIEEVVSLEDEPSMKSEVTEIVDKENYLMEKEAINDSLVNDYSYVPFLNEIIMSNSKCVTDEIEPVVEQITIDKVEPALKMKSEITIEINQLNKTIVVEDTPIQVVSEKAKTKERRNKKKRNHRPSYLLSESELLAESSKNACLPDEPVEAQGDTDKLENSIASEESFCIADDKQETKSGENLPKSVEPVDIQISSYIIDVDHILLEEHLRNQPIYIPNEIDTENSKDDIPFSTDNQSTTESNSSPSFKSTKKQSKKKSKYRIDLTADEGKIVKEESTQADLSHEEILHQEPKLICQMEPNMDISEKDSNANVISQKISDITEPTSNSVQSKSALVQVLNSNNTKKCRDTDSKTIDKNGLSDCTEKGYSNGHVEKLANASKKKVQFSSVKQRSNSIDRKTSLFTVKSYKRQNFLVIAASVLFFLTLGIFVAVLQK